MTIPPQRGTPSPILYVPIISEYQFITLRPCGQQTQSQNSSVTGTDKSQLELELFCFEYSSNLHYTLFIVWAFSLPLGVLVEWSGLLMVVNVKYCGHRYLDTVISMWNLTLWRHSCRLPDKEGGCEWSRSFVWRKYLKYLKISNISSHTLKPQLLHN